MIFPVACSYSSMYRCIMLYFAINYVVGHFIVSGMQVHVHISLQCSTLEQEHTAFLLMYTDRPILLYAQWTECDVMLSLTLYNYMKILGL